MTVAGLESPQEHGRMVVLAWCHSSVKTVSIYLRSRNCDLDLQKTKNGNIAQVWPRAKPRTAFRI